MGGEVLEKIGYGGGFDSQNNRMANNGIGTFLLSFFYFRVTGVW